MLTKYDWHMLGWLLLSITWGYYIFHTFLALIGFFFLGMILVGVKVMPCKRLEDHLNVLTEKLSPSDRNIFFSLYHAKRPKAIETAAFLCLLTPTASYLYQERYGLAILSLLTFEGCGLWWVWSFLFMEGDVARINIELANGAYAQIALMRSMQGPAPQPPTMSLETAAG